MSRRLQIGTVLALAVAALIPVPAAHAQGCVLCYTSLSAASPGGLHAFQLAMLVLLIPALLLFAGLFLLVYRHRATADADVWSSAAGHTLDHADPSPLA